jgi:Xaa-Pro aminopeptidase
VVEDSGARLLVAEHGKAEAERRVPADWLVTYEAVSPNGSQAAFSAALAGCLRSAKRPVGAELTWLPIAVAAQAGLEWAALEDISGPLRRLAACKAEWEVAAIEAACTLASLGQRAVGGACRTGASELEIFHVAQESIDSAAGTSVLLAGDLVGGPRAQRDGSGKPNTRPLEPGDSVLCDLVPVLDGFFGDSCSTLLVDEVAPSVTAAAGAVSDALAAAAETLAPGVATGAVDRAARNVLAAHDLACPHYIGHGVGHSQLDHPLIAQGSTAPLEEGHVVALEPGVYMPGAAAARAEHVYVITATGARQLTDHEVVVRSLPVPSTSHHARKH